MSDSATGLKIEAATPEATSDFRLGEWLVQPAARQLTRGDRVIRLEPKVMHVLLCLAATPGKPVQRQTLLTTVWSDVVVGDDSLNRAIHSLRRELGDDPSAPRYIETIPRVGYQLVARVIATSDLEPVPVQSATPRPAARTQRRRWLPATGLAAVLLLLLAIIWRSDDPGAPRSDEITLAVAPFTFSPASTDRAFLGEALAQEIRVHLRDLGSPRLRLIGWHSSAQLAQGGQIDARQARELQVDFVLSGRLAVYGAEIRVQSTLQRAADGSQIWGEVLTGDDGNLFRSIGELAGQIAGSVSSSLRVAGARRGGEFPGVEAYERYLRGLYLLEKTDIESLTASSDHFATATRIEPRFAKAHEGLAEAQLRLLFSGTPGAGDWKRVEEAAEAALALDQNLGYGHVAIGFVRLFRDWDFDAAGEAFERAVAINPSEGRIQSAHAAYLAAMGQLDEALVRARLAQRLDPRYLAVRNDLCWYLLYARLFEEAAVECQQALELEPEDTWSAIGLAESHRGLGQAAEAIALAARTLDLEIPEGATADLTSEEFWKQIDARQPDSVAPGPTAYVSATVSSLAGRPERSLAWLEAAFQSRNPWILYLRTDPRLDRLRDLPRFQQIVDRIGLPELPGS